MLISGPLAHAAGCRTHRGYAMWQPFRGGSTFVTAQMFAWTLYVIAFLLVSIILFAPHASNVASRLHRTEALRVFATMGAFAQEHSIA